MKEFISSVDALPAWAKLVLMIPFLDIFWWIYRIIRSIDSGNALCLVLGIVLLITPDDVAGKLILLLQLLDIRNGRNMVLGREKLLIKLPLLLLQGPGLLVIILAVILILIGDIIIDGIDHGIPVVDLILIEV